MESDALPRTLRETLTVFETPGEPLTTPEVASQLDLGRRSVYSRLERLVEEGYLQTKKVGANARVWWLAGQQPGTDSSEDTFMSPHLDDGALVADPESLIGDVLDEIEVGVFILDEDFDVTWINDTTERYFGLDRGEVLGRDKRTLINEHVSTVIDEGDRFRDRVFATYDDNTYIEQFECQVTPGPTRQRRWLEHRSKPIESGAYEGGRVECYYDITERRERESALRQQRDFTEQILDTTPIGVLTVDHESIVTTANDRATQLLELDSSLPVSLEDCLEAIYDGDGNVLPPSKWPHRRACETGDSIRDWHCQVEDSTGGRRWLSVNVEPLADTEGTEDQLLVTIEDVTRLKVQTERLQRQRDELESELEEVLGRVTDAFYALDRDWRFVHANERAEELIDFEGDGLVGKQVWDTFEWASDSKIRHEFERAIETQEPTSFEIHYPEPLDSWFDVHAYPSETGLSVYFRDITARKEREEALDQHREQLETLFELLPVGVIVADADGELLEANELAKEIWGGDIFDADSIEEYERFEATWADSGERVEPEEWTISRVLEGAEVIDPDIYEIESFDGEQRIIESCGMPIRDEEGAVRRGVVTVRDVTDRHAYQRKLEESERRYRTVVENIPNAAVALFDENLEYTAVGGELLQTLEVPEDEPIGQTIQERYSANLLADIEPHFEAVLDGESSEFEVEYEGRDLQASVHPLGQESDLAGMLMVLDITARKARERALEKRHQQQRMIAELGQYALEVTDLSELMADAVERVAETLDTELCHVFDLDPFAGELHLQQAVGWEQEGFGPTTIPVDANDTLPARTLTAGAPVIVSDGQGNSTDQIASWSMRADITSGMSVVIGPSDDPWGVIGTYASQPRDFSDEDVAFLRSAANILATAIDRTERERELQHQRAELAALNDLNQIVSEITERVIEKSTREDIEQTVCDALAASETYEFAWLAEVDPNSEEFEPRATAETNGYAEEITVTIDEDDPRGEGPGATAIRTQEPQIVQDVFSEPSFEPWRDAARKYGFRAVAAIPIVHEETVYGVLGVYADRPGAFDTTERDVISSLGEIVGHAIAAAERKRALMSDEVIELEFQIQQFFETLDMDVSTDDRITLDETVPLSDDEFIVYGSASPGAVDVVEQLVGRLPHWESVTIRNDNEEAQLEIKLHDPPVLSIVSSLGGYIDLFEIVDGDCQLRIHLAPGVQARRIIETVQEVYPTAEMVRRQQVTRAGDDANRLTPPLDEKLTDRQRAALDAAYHAGYFEWPRAVEGAEIADSLEVAPPTFSQHLRKAQQKVFYSLYAGSS